MKRTLAIFSALTMLFIISALLYNALAGTSNAEDELVYFETPSPTPAYTSPPPTPEETFAATPAAPTPTQPATAPPLSTQEPLISIPEPTTEPSSTPSLLPAGTKDFTVFTPEGTPRSLSDFAGRPIILNFWASWCTPCQEEMAYFQQAYELYGKDVHFFMISIDTSQNDAKSFMQKNGYTFDLYFDSTRQAQEAYSIASVPQTYFIDRNGSITAYKAGTLSLSALINGISRIK